MSKTLIQFPIYKITATGNDFLLVDLLDESVRAIWQKEFAQRKRGELAHRWCERHESLGADGLVVIEPIPKLDFAWDFYNSDGGSAELCGNAARAVSLFVGKKYGKNYLAFKTLAGEVSATIYSSTDIEVILPAVKEVQLAQVAEGVHFDFIRPGVPHAVVRLNASAGELKQQREIALLLKRQPRFQKDGVNVTFVRPISEGRAESVTFERGVEDFTLACGTGAIAAAYSLTHGAEKQAMEIQVPGGTLSVLWKSGRPHLRGPARIVAEMRLFKEEF